MSDIASKAKRQVGLSIAERLDKHRVVKGECWESSLDPNHKYPQIKIDGKKIMIHRLSYATFRGPIPDGIKVLHKCDNPRCHRPLHLFLGTTADNMRDMVRKGRHRAAPKEELCGPLIANLSNILSQKEVADCFSVSQTKVSITLRSMGISRGKETSFGKGHGLGGKRRK